MPRARLVVACTLGALGAWFVLIHYTRVSVTSDVDQLWAGTRALWQGRDPYAVPLSALGYPLFYPVPALLLVSPIAWLPLSVFRAVFLGLGVAVCVYALTAQSWWSLTLCLSAAFYYAVQGPEWSPLVTGAALLPWGGLVLAAKPTVGAALFLAYPSKAKLLSALGLVLLSFLMVPHWLTPWLAAVQRAPHYPLAMVPGGGVLLLALLRWRLPEGRLLAALACVPGTGLAYEWVPLWLIPRTPRQYLALALLTDLAFLPTVMGPPARMSAGTFLRWNAVIAVVLVYLPMLYLVLRSRRRDDGVVIEEPERRVDQEGREAQV